MIAKISSGLTVCDAIGRLDWSGQGDSHVDASDLDTVRNNFGLTGDYLSGDADGNYRVDLDDLNYVRSCFAAVPEPSSFALLALGAAGIGAFRRRCRAAVSR